MRLISFALCAFPDNIYEKKVTFLLVCWLKGGLVYWFMLLITSFEDIRRSWQLFGVQATSMSLKILSTPLLAQAWVQPEAYIHVYNKISYTSAISL